MRIDYSQSGKVVLDGSVEGTNVKKNNIGASVAPGVNDDSSAGYAVGSRWLDTTNSKEYVCEDASVGAASWIDLTAGVSEYYDETIDTGSIASLGTFTEQLVTGDMVSCLFQAVQAEVSAGACDSMTLEIYDGNPESSGIVQYKIQGYDISSAVLDDRNVWWMSASVAGEIYLKVTNGSASAVTLQIHIRIKGD